jgi:thioredoxin-related protein
MLLWGSISMVYSSEGWIQDLDTALKESAKTGKMVLADFTGSDWCGWCVKLDEEVFSQDEFKVWASKNVILCTIDSPQDRTGIGEEQFAKNQVYTQKYKVQGFPTILLLNKDGTVLGKTGFVQGGPAPFIDAINVILKNSDWPEKLESIDNLKTEEQVKLAIDLLPVENKTEEQTFKIARIIFANLKDKSDENFETAALILAATNDPQALKWLKDQETEGNPGPYLKHLVGELEQDFAAMSAKGDNFRQTGSDYAGLKKAAIKVLRGVKALKKYKDNALFTPELENNLIMKRIFAFYLIGKREKAFTIIKENYNDSNGKAQQGEMVKMMLQRLM